MGCLWASQNVRDLDLGSSRPLLLPAGRALISGKAGDVLLLNTALGHLRTPLAHLSGCAAYGGSAYDPTQHAAFLPCESGLQRIGVGVGVTTVGSKRSVGDGGSPVIGGGLVWFQSHGTLELRSERSGALHSTRPSSTSVADRFVAAPNRPM